METLQIAETLRNVRNPSMSKFKSLEHAIVYIGSKSLNELLMSSALRLMPLPPGDFAAEVFWEREFLTGVLDERLAQRFAPMLNPDEAFLAGSTCNIGKLVLAFCFPPLASKIGRDMGGLETWRQAEANYGFPDHAILGEIGASLWGFPLYLLNVTGKHHAMPLPGAAIDLMILAALGNQMTHWVLMRPHRIEFPLLHALRGVLGLSEKELDDLGSEFSKLKQAAAA